jgi:hypothetical protein
MPTNSYILKVFASERPELNGQLQVFNRFSARKNNHALIILVSGFRGHSLFKKFSRTGELIIP